jgi:hypothetical protein
MICQYCSKPIDAPMGMRLAWCSWMTVTDLDLGYLEMLWPRKRSHAAHVAKALEEELILPDVVGPG